MDPLGSLRVRRGNIRNVVVFKGIKNYLTWCARSGSRFVQSAGEVLFLLLANRSAIRSCSRNQWVSLESNFEYRDQALTLERFWSHCLPAQLILQKLSVSKQSDKRVLLAQLNVGRAA